MEPRRLVGKEILIMSRIEFLVDLEMELRDRGIQVDREELREFVQESWPEAEDNPEASTGPMSINCPDDCSRSSVSIER